MKLVEISLGNENLFSLAIGKRRTKRELLSMQEGEIPIISARLDKPFGYLNSDEFKYSVRQIVLWNIDSSRWATRLLPPCYKFIPTDHCGYMSILNDNIDPGYVCYKLYEIGLSLGFKHEYRASIKNIKDITFSIPINDKGIFDLKCQQQIAQKYFNYTEIRNKIEFLIEDISDKQINIKSDSVFSLVPIKDIMIFKKGSSVYNEKYCIKHIGPFPVYSAGTKDKVTIGHINSWDYEKECLRITTNGHYAGTVDYIPFSKFSLNGDVGILYFRDDIDKELLDYEYIEYALQKARGEYGFNWNNKPTEEDINALEIPIPKKNGKWDIDEQKRISERFVLYRTYIKKLKSTVLDFKKTFIKVD